LSSKPNYGTDALTDVGKDIYENAFDSFGIECGQFFISDVREGAQLIFSILLEFDSPTDKESYLSHYKYHQIDLTNITTLA